MSPSVSLRGPKRLGFPVLRPATHHHAHATEFTLRHILSCKPQNNPPSSLSTRSAAASPSPPACLSPPWRRTEKQTRVSRSRQNADVPHTCGTWGASLLINWELATVSQVAGRASAAGTSLALRCPVAQLRRALSFCCGVNVTPNHTEQSRGDGICRGRPSSSARADGKQADRELVSAGKERRAVPGGDRHVPGFTKNSPAYSVEMQSRLEIS